MHEVFSFFVNFCIVKSNMSKYGENSSFLRNAGSISKFKQVSFQRSVYN